MSIPLINVITPTVLQLHRFYSDMFFFKWYAVKQTEIVVAHINVKPNILLAPFFIFVYMEKDGEDQLDRSCEKWRSVTESQWEEEYPTWNKKTEG